MTLSIDNNLFCFVVLRYMKGLNNDGLILSITFIEWDDLRELLMLYIALELILLFEERLILFEERLI